MIRERVLKVVLVLVGLLFSAGVYPVAMDLWHANPSDTGDDMMLSLYTALGVFLLLAVRNPAAHRSLIAFAAWVQLRSRRGDVGACLAAEASERAHRIFVGLGCAGSDRRRLDRAGSRQTVRRAGIVSRFVNPLPEKTSS